MAERFDKLSQQNASLQILIDQYSEAEDYDDRDEVMQDIAAHPSESAIAFLKVVAEQDDDPSTRCDAWCAVHKRQASPESRAALLAMLVADKPYELVHVLETFAELAQPDAEVAAKAWSALAKQLPREAQTSALAALEIVDPAFMTNAKAVLDAAVDPTAFDYDLLEGVASALSLQPAADARPLLNAFSQRIVTLAKNHPDDAVLLEELAGFVTQQAALFDAAETKEDDDDE